MSAYGAIQRRDTGFMLQPTNWTGSTSYSIETEVPSVSVYHLTLRVAKEHLGLIEYLCSVFAKEVEDGRTYPQEGPIDLATFEAYFFAADVFVAISTGSQSENADGSMTSLSIEQVRNNRCWEDSIAGFFYIKPNYPGRSSHICNAGFVVPPKARGRGYGSALAKSYVFYAPQLGYEASVFNLVFVNNTASIKLWKRLGFTKAGLIPRAGRLKREDGKGEEYVDAWVFYRSFVVSD